MKAKVVRLSWPITLLRGFASLIDLAPRVENPYNDRSDLDAIMGDWEVVGSDLCKALAKTVALPTASQTDEPRSD